MAPCGRWPIGSTSPDIEDFVTVIDGRDRIVAEADQAPPGLRRYLIDAVRTLVATRAFDDALPGQIPSDEGSQLRLPALRRKLRSIAALA